MTVQERRQRGRPRLADGPREGASVQSLDRAIALLELVADGNGLTLTQVSAAAGLAPSTAYRMLATLQQHGMVEFEEVGQLWHVGVQSFRIGSAFLRRRKIADRTRPVMLALVERCGETANLAVVDDDAVVFASQIETHAPIRAFFRPGTRSPFHASGVGKAILSHLPREQVERMVARTGLERFTPTTITTLDGLMADLSRSRARGWAVDDEERNQGMRCVASAIFNEYGEPIAGISVSGPVLRMTTEAAERLGPVVREAAREITESIAGRQPSAG